MEKQKFIDRWPLTARGYLLFLLAIILLFNNSIPVSALSIYMGITLILTGAAVLYLSFKNYSLASKEFLFHSEGFNDTLTGILILIFASPSGFATFTIFGVYAVLTGILNLFQLYYSIRDFYIPNWFLVSIYIVLVLLGVLILIIPGTSKLMAYSLIGLYLIIFGVIYLVESFQPEALKKYSL